MAWQSFVAIGDSFTEGMNDLDPGTGRYRGWADLVASRLATESAAFTYANLAIRGRLFDNIVEEQVPPALRMHPDLMSFAAGGNDALRRGFDVNKIIGRLDAVMKLLRASGADVITFTSADLTSRLPLQRVMVPRVRAMNDAIAAVADRRGAILIDLWADDEFRNSALWSVDRLHMNSLGHQRTAAHVLTALGVAPEPSWLDAPGRPAVLPWVRARVEDVRWAREHLAPWVKRRLTGTSSGDDITAKRPALAPVTMPAAAVMEGYSAAVDG